MTLAYRHHRPELYGYARDNFFALLFTSYIIGSLTGPGIWYSTTVANPRGISELIHNFMGVWAAEWVWFVTEVTLVYVMVYLFDKVGHRTYMYLSWVFAVVSWGTMLIIVGILSFMMSPGSDAWFQSGNVLQAFYNPNYFPHLLMRTGFMIALGALLGLAVATRIREADLRAWIVRRLAGAGLVGMAFGGAFFPLYLHTLPDRARVTLDGIIPSSVKLSIAAGIGALALALLLLWLRPKLRYAAGFVVILATVTLVLAIYPQERVREWIRKPYIAGDYLYVNQLVARDVPGKGIRSELETVERHGFLSVHPFVPERLKTVTPENVLEAGRAMALVSCAACHSLEDSGPRPLVLKMQGMTDPNAVEQFLRARLNGDPAHGGAPYMPKLVGTDDEIRGFPSTSPSKIAALPPRPPLKRPPDDAEGVGHVLGRPPESADGIRSNHARV
ncbi:cytochrome C [Hydrogenibacillus sp. N12]|uniref:cytochrome C n=1 Tax=Hydrogenibacillus sp. N12 TaxID=2866627 RepID=UPI001C7CB1AC|nr:cytochrome C [Hydrogenibacillus sp. N12]QZA33463.1 cytochrome C [Hydrogenibacillus sp. N12]